MIFLSNTSQKFCKNITISFICTLLVTPLSACIVNAGEVPSAVMTSPLLAQPGTKFVTPEMLLEEIKNYDYDNEPSVSWLDDNNILYLFPDRKSTENPTIGIYNLAEKKSLLLTEGRFAHASPDARWIAFVKGEGAAKQLWVMDRNDHNHTSQLTHVQNGLGVYGYSYNFIWSADSKKLIISHQDFIEPWEKKPPATTQIEEIDINSSHSQLLATIDGAVRYMDYLPNSKEVLFVNERHGFSYHESNDMEYIQAVSLSGDVRTLAEFNGLQQLLDPRVSPDGKLISILYDAEHPAFTYMLSAGLISTDSNTSLKSAMIQQLTHEMQVYSARWTPDAQKLVVLRQYGAYKQLYQIDIASSQLTQLTNSPINIKRFEISPNGSQIAYFGEDAHGNHMFKIVNINGSNNHTLIKNAAVASDIALSEIREIEWKTEDYPVNMRGILIMPLHYKKGDRYPLLVDIHGGGAGAHLILSGVIFNTSLEWQMWAAKGFAVFVPEFRSSGSFGSLAITRDLYEKHELLDGDLRDIDMGVDFLIASGIGDQNKLAIIGHSAGGNRANWFLVSTHRYQTIISHEGWADELGEALYYAPTRSDPAYGGSPQEVPENYIKNSSLYFADKATTPTLFLMGNPELGGADPIDSVLKLYQAIKKKGVETEYIKYSDEGHGLEKDENKKDALSRIIKWLDKYLK
jgi:dipeptidyl aminopeptidase/acylaminoacyl peptidase